MSMMKLLIYMIIGLSIFSSLKKYPSLLIIIIPIMLIYVYFKRGISFHGNGGILSSNKMFLKNSQSNTILSAAMELIKLNPTNKPEPSKVKQFLTLGHKRLYELFNDSYKEYKIIHPELNVSEEIYNIIQEFAKKKNYLDASMLFHQLINSVLTEMFKELHLNFDDSPLNKIKIFHSLLIRYVKIDYFESKVKIYEEISKKSRFTVDDVLNLIEIYIILRNFDINLLLNPSKNILENHQFESLSNLSLINQLINPPLSSSKLIKSKAIQVPPQFNSIFKEKVKQTFEGEEEKIRAELSENNDLNNAIIKLNTLNKEKSRFGEKYIKFITEEQLKIGKALKALAVFFSSIASFIILQIFSVLDSYNKPIIGTDLIIYIYQSLAFFILSLGLYFMARTYRGVLQ